MTQQGRGWGKSQPADREQYAGLVSRLIALAVDAALLAVIIPAIGAGGPALWSALVGSAPEWLRVGAGVIAGLVPFVYFWLSWCTAGKTVGGMLLGIAVCRRNGSRVRAAKAAARSFFGLIFAPFWLAGMTLTLIDPRRRALHDIVLGTVVFRTGK